MKRLLIRAVWILGFQRSRSKFGGSRGPRAGDASAKQKGGGPKKPGIAGDASSPEQDG